MLELTRPYGAPVRAFASAAVDFQLAREPWQVRGYWSLRREIFCEETALFSSQLQERDEHDRRAQPIVAVAHWAGTSAEVVGVVRIYDVAPGVWYGGRLGVSAAYRTRPRVGSGLIRTAVGTAKAQGCTRFLATVLRVNAAYFERQQFERVGDLELCGRPHVLMQARLDRFEALACAPLGEAAA